MTSQTEFDHYDERQVVNRRKMPPVEDPERSRDQNRRGVNLTTDEERLSLSLPIPRSDECA